MSESAFYAFVQDVAGGVLGALEWALEQVFRVVAWGL